MKFLSELEKKPWSADDISRFGGAAALGLLVLSIFGIPLLVQKFMGERLGFPDMMLLCSLPGICAYGFFSAEKLPLRFLKRNEIRPLLKFGLLLLLVTGVVNFLWKELLTILAIEFEAEQQAVKIIQNTQEADKVKLFFGLCIFAPLTEELLFRRMIYGFLLRVNWRTALLLTALVFSLCHFFVAGIPGLLVLGLGFQFSYLKFRNLSAAVILHAMVNSLAFWAALNK